jgi:phosphatidylserine decarboxylase
MVLAPEGRGSIRGSAALVIVAWIGSAVIGGIFLDIAAIFLTLLFGFVVWFFRDPARVVPEDPDCLVSVGDGLVVGINPLDHVEYLDGPGVQVSIFLNVFNVHVNRTPMPGVVELHRYQPGRFLNAANHRASLENEQTVLGIRDGHRKVLVRQIAGLIARRVICHVGEGDTVSRGQRFGLIKFGSRMDVVVPPDVQIAVQKGQRVTGGETVIGRFSHE